MKRHWLIEIGIVFSLVVIIIYFSYPYFMLFHDEKSDDLLNYKIVDVIKYQGSIRYIVEINEHQYLMVKAHDNMIFRHYENCPNCQKSFKSFIFSIYDGCTVELRNKEKLLKSEEK